MKNSEKNINKKIYWRSLEELSQSPEFIEQLQREFPQGASELENSGVDRRKFLQVMGASFAFAGVGGLTGCWPRKPEQRILPFSKRPEDIVPGKPLYYATAAECGGAVLGLIVTSQDGRPSKIEGNPDHPMSLGSTNAWAQASVLNLYDPDRSRNPLNQGKPSTWENASEEISGALSTLKKNGGVGLAFLLEPKPSPTYFDTIKKLRTNYPSAKFSFYNPASASNFVNGIGILGESGLKANYDLSKANVVLSLDSDFLHTEGDSVKNARQFSDHRRLSSEKDSMNRLYVVEPSFTVTGFNADNHFKLKGIKIGPFLISLVAELFSTHLSSSQSTEGVVKWIKSLQGSGGFENSTFEIAKDLASNIGSSLIIVGERQPSWVHALALLANSALQNIGSTINFTPDEKPDFVGTLNDLKIGIQAREVSTLIMVGVNPLYDAPADFQFKDLFSQIPTTIHLGYLPDETAISSKWHLPRNHYLESWGDLVASDGTKSIQQPLIAPLFDSISEIEFLAQVNEAAVGLKQNGYELVQNYWKSLTPDFSKRWRKWVHDGIIQNNSSTNKTPNFSFGKLLENLEKIKFPELMDNDVEIDFYLDPSVYDGRYSNNSWLQELPDPVTKIVWDNAALLNPKLASENKISSGDIIEIFLKNRSIKIATFVTPGVADNVVVLPLGYGSSQGRVSKGAGFNTYAIRTSDAPFIGIGGTFRKTSGKYKLSTTQEHWAMESRPLIRETTLDGYKKNPNYVEEYEMIPKEDVKSLWKEPNPTTGQQWGMSIDLTSCIGCNACTIACQSENNIPVVGKDQVSRGREMHWIRVDRYFVGDTLDPEVAVQPVPCMQCENAPCESVCPVAATTHSTDGLNDMTYNRCIGTRYCSNNCPYKVRRFNFYAFQKYNDRENELLPLQRNQNVTVRFRGVMEKCTYCVQRIRGAQIEYHVKGIEVVPDGVITPACAQACPTKAIVFGDINNPNSKVSVLKQQNRNYGMLRELNTQPRTTYLGKIRNPNPALA